MPGLEHSLGALNPRNSLRREVRAGRVMARLPVELAGSLIGLRKQRLALERLFQKAESEGDAATACRLSDSLVKVADAFHRLHRESRRATGRSAIYDLPATMLEASIIETAGNQPTAP